jgi:Uma2 family endonuclease
MNLAQPRADRYYSREEFRQWCEAQTKGRYERVDGLIVAMTPDHRRAGDGIDTRIIVNGPIAMAPPGIVITVEEIYGAV